MRGVVEQPPGTVSKILWHFTGGPRWDSVKNRQASSPKPVEDAYEALVAILKSKELHLGEYREVVRVRVPKLRQHKARKTQETKKPTEYTIVALTSSQVCCIADIPIAHL